MQRWGWHNWSRRTGTLAAAAMPEIRGIWMGRLTRHSSDQYGIVMEFDNEAGHKVYDTHPAHDEWVKTYSKVRAEPTTTFDLQGQ